MKQLIHILTAALLAVSIVGCEKDGNYPGGKISPYIAIFDVKDLYKGNDVPLNINSLYGSTSITGVVVSDHSGGNMPQGLLVLQDKRRLNELRGIALNIGNDAANYLPGDSLIVNVDGGTLKEWMAFCKLPV